MSRIAPTIALIFAIAVPAFADHHGSSKKGSAAKPPSDEAWEVLFDGSSLDAWRGYRKKEVPAGWSIQDGTLLFAGQGGGDLVTREKFRNFELELQWKISEGGNSGVLYLVSEDQPQPYRTGLEFQVLDNGVHRDGGNKLTSASALYGLYPAKTDPKPVGDWNLARIRHVDGEVKHWLNGELIVDAQIGSDDWNERIGKSKFASWERFAKNREGHLSLQDHGDVVQYRAIKIRRLD